MNLPPTILGYQVVRDEADIIEENLDFYLSQDIPLVIIDNGSSDGTFELLEKRRKQLASLISKPTTTFDLESLLRFALQKCKTFNPRWMLHIDADHFYDPPSNFGSLFETVEAADSEGANCIVFNEYTFYHTGRDDPKLHKVQDRMRHYRLHLGLDQPRLFRCLPGVDNAHHGGHKIHFDNISLNNFREVGALRHYPLRSFAQGRKKLADRRQRYSSVGKLRGWHQQYDGLVDSGWYVQEPSNLAFWEPGQPLRRDITSTEEDAWPETQ